MTQQQRRAKCIDLEGGEQLGRVEIGQALLRHEVGTVQHAGGVDDQVEWSLPRHRVRRSFDAGGIGEIQRRLGRPAQRNHQGAARIAAQGIGQRGADATGCADDQRTKPFGE